MLTRVPLRWALASSPLGLGVNNWVWYLLKGGQEGSDGGGTSASCSQPAVLAQGRQHVLKKENKPKCDETL